VPAGNDGVFGEWRGGDRLPGERNEVSVGGYEVSGVANEVSDGADEVPRGINQMPRGADAVPGLTDPLLASGVDYHLPGGGDAMSAGADAVFGGRSGRDDLPDDRNAVPAGTNGMRGEWRHGGDGVPGGGNEVPAAGYEVSAFADQVSAQADGMSRGADQVPGDVYRLPASPGGNGVHRAQHPAGEHRQCRAGGGDSRACVPDRSDESTLADFTGAAGCAGEFSREQLTLSGEVCEV
jgi:hypothetical protein